MTDILRPAAPAAPASATGASASGRWITPPGGLPLPVLAGAVAVLALTVAAWAAEGHRFPVDVLSVGALLVCGTAAGRDGAGRLPLAIAGSLLGYAALSALAVLAPGSAAGAALVSLWSAAWAVPLATIQVAALLAGGYRRWATGLGVFAGAGIGAAALWAPPSDPFEGYRAALAAPADVLPVIDVWTSLWLVTVVVTPVALAARRRTAPAVAAATVPLAVLICLGLAVLRDPGGVDPSAGSSGFTVALALAGPAAALVLGGTARTVARVAGCLVVAAAVAVGLLGGTLLAALAAPAGTAAVVAAAGGLAVLLTGVARVGAARVTTYLTPSVLTPPVPPAPDPTPPRAGGLTVLTPRENDVMALVADGLSNPEIAEDWRCRRGRSRRTFVRCTPSSTCRRTARGTGGCVPSRSGGTAADLRLRADPDVPDGVPPPP